MELGNFAPTPVYKVEHSKGIFSTQSAGKAQTYKSMSGVIVGVRYGRKMFVKGAGKWSVGCMSTDSIMGKTDDGVNIRCQEDTSFCEGCKSFLVVALLSEDGPLLLELSASVANKLYTSLTAYLRSGVPLDQTGYNLKLGPTRSSRVNFSQLVVNELPRDRMGVSVTRDRVDSVLKDLDEHMRSSFVPRGSSRAKGASLAAGELTVP